MGFKEIVAIITLVPALAWFITSFVQIYKLYQVNEEKIKKIAVEKKEELRDTAEKLTTKAEEFTEKAEKMTKDATESAKHIKEKVEQKIHPTPAPTDDESQPPAEGSGE